MGRERRRQCAVCSAQCAVCPVMVMVSRSTPVPPLFPMTLLASSPDPIPSATPAHTPTPTLRPYSAAGYSQSQALRGRTQTLVMDGAEPSRVRVRVRVCVCARGVVLNCN